MRGNKQSTAKRAGYSFNQVFLVLLVVEVSSIL